MTIVREFKVRGLIEETGEEVYGYVVGELREGVEILLDNGEKVVIASELVNQPVGVDMDQKIIYGSDILLKVDDEVETYQIGKRDFTKVVYDESKFYALKEDDHIADYVLEEFTINEQGVRTYTKKCYGLSELDLTDMLVVGSDTFGISHDFTPIAEEFDYLSIYAHDGAVRILALDEDDYTVLIGSKGYLPQVSVITDYEDLGMCIAFEGEYLSIKDFIRKDTVWA